VGSQRRGRLRDSVRAAMSDGELPSDLAACGRFASPCGPAVWLFGVHPASTRAPTDSVDGRATLLMSNSCRTMAGDTLLI
jgi:hypothetical protein